MVVQLFVAFITSAKEVIFSSAFVCLFVSNIMQKLLKRLSQNLMVKCDHGRLKKPLDFVDNPGQILLQLRLG